MQHSRTSHRAQSTTDRHQPSGLRLTVLGLAVLGLALAAASCSGIRVSSDSDKDTPPTGFDSYAWLDTALATPKSSDEFGTEVRDAIDSGLASAGYERSAPGEADFFISFETEVSVEERAKDPYFAGVRSERYELGTLTIEWVDPKTLQPLWRGSGSSELRSLAVSGGVLTPTQTPVANEGDRDWQIEKKVAAILEQAPPRE